MLPANQDQDVTYTQRLLEVCVKAINMVGAAGIALNNFTYASYSLKDSEQLSAVASVVGLTAKQLQLPAAVLVATVTAIQNYQLNAAIMRQQLQSAIALTDGTEVLPHAVAPRYQQDTQLAPDEHVWLVGSTYVTGLVVFVEIQMSRTLLSVLPKPVYPLALQIMQAATVGRVLQNFSTGYFFVKNLYLSNRLWFGFCGAGQIPDDEYTVAITKHLNDGYYFRHFESAVLHLAISKIAGGITLLHDILSTKLMLDFALRTLGRENSLLHQIIAAIIVVIILIPVALQDYTRSHVLANKVAAWYEERYYPEPVYPATVIRDSDSPRLDENAPPQTSEPHSINSLVACVILAAISCIGASVAAVKAYNFHQYLYPAEFRGQTLPIMTMLIVTAMKFAQSLAIEGSYTMAAATPCTTGNHGLASLRRVGRGIDRNGDVEMQALLLERGENDQRL